MPAEKSVTAILVTYNSAGVVASAIASLLAEPKIASVVVVDNCSADGSCELIERRFPTVTLIRNTENAGFGRGNNLALARVTTEFALLVNPDAIPQEGAVGALLAAAEHYPDAAILAPTLLYEDGRIQPSHKTSLFTRKLYPAPYIRPEGDICAEFLSGALWLLRMEAIRKTGAFDPELFFYYEDDDLCLRLRTAGYALVLVYEAHAVHAMGNSSAPSRDSRTFRLYHDTWSRLYMEYKYRGKAAAERMSTLQLRRYRWRLCLGRITCIRSLVTRYGTRLRATRDFIAYLSTAGN